MKLTRTGVDIAQQVIQLHESTHPTCKLLDASRKKTVEPVFKVDSCYTVGLSILLKAHYRIPVSTPQCAGSSLA